MKLLRQQAEQRPREWKDLGLVLHWQTTWLWDHQAAPGRFASCVGAALEEEKGAGLSGCVALVESAVALVGVILEGTSLEDAEAIVIVGMLD